MLMMCLFAFKFRWITKSLFPVFVALETWSFCLPCSNAQCFSNIFFFFFNTGAHISKESSQRTQIKQVGKFWPAAIETGLGVPELLHHGSLSLWRPLELLCQTLGFQRSHENNLSGQYISITKKETEAQSHACLHWARTGNCLQTPRPVLFPGNGPLLTVLLL